MSIMNFCTLVGLCLRHSYTQWQGTCYKQVGGGAMGSAVVAHAADIFIDDVTYTALTNWKGSPIPFLMRYVDDTLSALPFLHLVSNGYKYIG